MSERVTLTHGCSLSNLPLFVAEGAGLFADEGLQVDVPAFSAMSATEEILASGGADIGSTAFTQPLIDSADDDPLVVFGGSGLKGIAILAQPTVTGIADLAGRPVGTFRGDPLEVLLYDALQAEGLAFDDVEVVYLDDFADALQAFADQRLAAITLAEPHATRIRALGAVELSDGTKLWGDPFPDTVLVAKASFLAVRPQAVARALAMEPSILLMDEPFAALDVQTRAKLQDFLIQVWRDSGASVLFVTHHIDEALALADRIVVFTARPGRIKSVVPIDMPRPRDPRDPKFHELRDHLIDLLADEVDRAFAEQEGIGDKDKIRV